MSDTVLAPSAALVTAGFISESPASAIASFPQDSASYCQALYNLHQAGATLQLLTTAARFVLGMELCAAKESFGETRGKRKTAESAVFKNYGHWVKESVGFSERRAREFVAVIEALREGRGESIGLPARLFPEVRPSSLGQTQQEALFRTIGQAIAGRSFYAISSDLDSIPLKDGHDINPDDINKEASGTKDKSEDDETRDAIAILSKQVSQFDKWIQKGAHSRLPTAERVNLIARLEGILAEIKGVGA